MSTQVSIKPMTMRDKNAGWLFGATLVIVLPSLIVVAHAISGG